MGLLPHQLERKVRLLGENLKLLEQEETYWYNRSHETWLLKGDNDTKYFHKCANGRKRKTQSFSLENEGPETAIRWGEWEPQISFETLSRCLKITTQEQRH